MSGTGFDLQWVSDDRLPWERLLAVADAAVRGGVTTVQLRDKNATARTLIAQAAALSSLLDGRANFVINDRLDVALAARDAGAHIDGVHLGQDDVPPPTARRVLGADATIGWTANTPEHLAAADALPAGTLDYLGVGVIRPTSTKPDHPEALGIIGFARLAAMTSLPCIAIGGVDASDIALLKSAGAAGVAVVTAISDAADPEAAARTLLGPVTPW